MKKPLSSALLALSLLGVLSAPGQTPDLTTPDACLPRVLAMNEIARGWQQRALAAEAELARIRAQADLAKARAQADRMRFDAAIANQSYSQPSSSNSAPSGYGSAPSSNSSAKTEHVRGYVRKDGTVVQPYMRRPRSR